MRRGHPARPPADHRRDRTPVRHQPRRQQLQLASLRRWRRSTLPSHFAVHAFLISAPHSAARQVPCLLSSPCGLPHDFSGPTLSFCEDAGRSPAIANPPLTFSDTHGCLTLTTVRPRSLPCMLFHPHSFPGYTPPVCGVPRSSRRTRVLCVPDERPCCLWRVHGCGLRPSVRLRSVGRLCPACSCFLHGCRPIPRT